MKTTQPSPSLPLTRVASSQVTIYSSKLNRTRLPVVAQLKRKLLDFLNTLKHKRNKKE
jgi:hypothetical protein